MNTNKIAVRTVALTSLVLEAAIKSGAVLSVLIAPTSVKLFCTMAIVQYPPLSAAAAKACAHNLRRAGIAFAAADKELLPTLASIPAEHLRGEVVVEKVYGPAAPATRPVVTLAPVVAPVVPVAPVATAKKVRKPRTVKAEQAVG